MKTIKHIYFDVGGVLLLDFSGTNKWSELKRDLGITQQNDHIFEQVWKSHEQNICLNCDVDTLIKELEGALDISFPNNYSLLLDFISRFEINKTIWLLAQAAKNQYTTGLLTNMYPRMLDLIIKQRLIPDIKWDVVVDSSIVGFQKPEARIFEIAEELAKTDPESIFFIDNSVPNLEAAKARHWQTFLYDSVTPDKSSKELGKLLHLY